MDLNRVTIIGRLTQKPELRTTPTGQNVVSFSIATNRVWTDDSGVKQEKAEFHNCVAWRRLAEIISQYLDKGRRIYVEGRLQTRDWVGQDGVKRYRTEVVLENMIMLDSPARSNNNIQDNSSQTVPQSIEQTNAPVSDEEIKVEDIPF